MNKEKIKQLKKSIKNSKHISVDSGSYLETFLLTSGPADVLSLVLSHSYVCKQIHKHVGI